MAMVRPTGFAGKGGQAGGYKTTMCNFFLQGCCMKGDACTFSHGEGEGLANLVSQLSSGSSAGQRAAAALPPWLVAAVNGQPPNPGAQFPEPARERPIPAWLKAAQGQKGAVLGAKASGRQRVTPNRIPGTLTDWNGTMGWVKPDKAIVHPDAAKSVKGLYLVKADVMPEGAVLTKGMQVTCFAYADGMKLGAEKCMEFKGSTLGEDKVAQKGPIARTAEGSLARSAESGKAKGKGSKMGKDAWKGPLAMASSGFKGGQKGVWVFQPAVWDNRPAKGGGKQKQGGGKSSQHDGGRRKDLPRTRISEGIGVTGKCVEWKGTHGWIEPDVPVDHPKASKHKGHLYIHQKDIMCGDMMLYTGQTVNFHVYEDGNGLGAEECIPG